MKHLFIPYELAVIAKEKGFDEPCLAGYKISKDKLVSLTIINNHHSYIQAPLYQQITDWFREKHEIEIGSSINENKGKGLTYNAYIKYVYQNSINSYGSSYHSYYEAYNNAIKEAFKLIKTNN